MQAVFGEKIGMTQVFNENGECVPVTVVNVGKHYVVNIRTMENNGYEALVVGYKEQKESRVKLPVNGQYKVSGLKPLKYVREIRMPVDGYKVGQELTLENFNETEYVDVIGVSKGKGFQGVMKRHGFRGGRKTHGSKFHRAPGAIGQCAWPSRVFKGKKMAGRMGGKQCTQKNLKIQKFDLEKSVILIRGSVPGTKNNLLYIKKSNK